MHSITRKESLVRKIGIMERKKEHHSVQKEYHGAGQ